MFYYEKMKTKRAPWLFLFFLLLPLVFATAQNQQTVNEEKEKIIAAILANHLPWTAGDTEISVLPEAERRMYLGGIRPTLQRSRSPFKKFLIPRGQAKPAALPDQFDWHSQNGRNWVTPVRNQGGCGSCWAFAAVAAVEAMYKIERNQPSLDIDLSEQQIVSCSGAGNCQFGGDTYGALIYIATTGVTQETCFPYQAHDLPCGPCADWYKNRYFIRQYQYVTQSYADSNAIMTALQEGPVAAWFEVYNDFYYYTGGIYEVTPGAIDEGGHVVLVVGYNKTDRYWICKNSWGVHWGEAGYFKIRWDEAEIGSWVIKATTVVAAKSGKGRM